MAQIKTVVTLDRREVDTHLIEAARKHLDKCVGSASLVFDWDQGPGPENAKLVCTGVTVTFVGKVNA